MKTLGLIGGLSWLSTAEYYRIINETVGRRLGGLNAARLILYSVNLNDFLPPSDERGWHEFGARFGAIAVRLQNAGAEGLILCANTPHKVADDIRAAVRIPLIHIAEVVAREISKHNLHTVGLLGTIFTMEDAFFTESLSALHIRSIIPGKGDRDFIHNSIFDELGKGVFTAATRRRYVSIVESLVADGAQGIILACTELPFVLKPEDVTTPLFDTTLIHAVAAADFALRE